MKKRVISGVLIGVVLTVVLVVGGPLLWATLLAVSVIAYREVAGAMGLNRDGKKVTLPDLAVYTGIVTLYLGLLITGSLSWFIIAAMLVVFGLFFVYVLRFPAIHSREVAASLFCFLYVPCMLSFIYLLRIQPYGNHFAWIPFNAWICDTSAFFAGKFFGRHKLAPVLSPKKTVEGAIGGVAGSVLAGFVFSLIMGYILGDYRTIPFFIVATALESVITQLGDLVASGIKRDHQIKDFGRIIPGHGGIMDRFDSVIPAAPFAYLCIIVLWRILG
ncbi:MAG: phosphatidate cytidylyltransferase [Lachnospiraceae bacterium]|nr:phosphatidate cytidylyltransferase [Lachnospiraceae bacterium]